MNTNDMTSDELTHSERAAKTILVRFKLRSHDEDEIRAIIRREIPGVDDLDALLRRAAVLEKALRGVEWVKQIVGGETVEACPECHQYKEDGHLHCAVGAALSASPTTTPNPLAKPAVFVPLTPERDGHDMQVGPCACGAWHDRADANAEIVRLAVELAQAIDDFCGGLIGGANWTDHTGRVANMTRINDAARIAEMILRDAAALRAGAGHKDGDLEANPCT